jgi:serine/threonine protein kinase
MAERGRYKIIRKIADGGMAEIYLGVQRGMEGFERPVVLKRILGALLAEPQFKNLMIDEAHVAMSLLHSNIAQVLDLGQAKGRYYLVLELVDGWDLNQILNRLKHTELKLPPELALFMAAETCRALAYAHGKKRNGLPMGIVHRDVSPHNVLISAEGEIKLTDFGIAKAFVKRENTVQGVIKGKLAFMSPEQASGEAIDSRSDLFSVGTMLYLMLTGKRPFDSPTDMESLMRVQRGECTPPETYNSEIPRPLSDLIKKAMRKSPANRFQTADEMLEEIEKVQRSSFTPAGKTELKRWLGELEARDGIPSIARAPSLSQDPNETLELGDNDIELEEDATGAAVGPRASAGMTATDFATPTPARDDASVQRPIVPLATGPTKIDAIFPEPARHATGSSAINSALAVAPTEGALATHPEGATSAIVLQPQHGIRRTAIYLVGAMALGATIWWARQADKTPPPTPTPVAEKPHTESTVKPEEPAADDPPPKIAEPTPDASPSEAPEQSAPDPDDVDEASLLAQAETDIGDKVIGEDDPQSDTEAKPRDTSHKPGKSKAEQPTVVSVKVTTTPTGAVIRLKNRIFGRAPMNLRFRAGITYELDFVKSGYITAHKRVTVTRRKQQSVRVALKKKAAQKKGFFQRLFGK